MTCAPIVMAVALAADVGAPRESASDQMFDVAA